MRPSSAELALARRSLRQVVAGATIVGLTFGGTAASSALAYATTFTTVAEREQIASTTAGDRGLTILMGPVSGIGTIGGYTVYKGFVFLTTIGAIWAVLAATRVLRGEEDAGRWQLVLSGATRAARATGVTLGSLAAGTALVGLLTAACVAAVGRDARVGLSVGGSIAYATSLAMVVSVFAGVGAVTSQLGSTRRVANGIGMSVVGVAFALRMVADAADALRWVRWLTPFGWTQLVDPFGANRILPVVVAVGASLALGAVAVSLAERRDVGAGTIGRADDTDLHPFGLGSTFGLSARLERGVLVGWMLAALGWGLLLGTVSRLATSDLPKSMTDMLDRFGVEGDFVSQFFGTVFLLVATVVALIPASQIAAAADEETSGRLVRILAGPTPRARWLIERLGLAVAGTLVASVVSAIAIWVPAAAQDVPIGLVTLLGASVNVVPTALLALGIGALVLAVAPRHAGGVTYVVVLLSVVFDLISSMVHGWRWLGQLSIFHHLALAPAEPVSAGATIGVLAAVAAMCAAAVVVFSRRDLHSA